MIVFDTSTVVGAATNGAGLPRRAIHRAFGRDEVAVSDDLLAEIEDVLYRPRLTRYVDPILRDEMLALFGTLARRFVPAVPVTDCRDPGDNMVLELALEAQASVIVSSDRDLLALHPWRGVPILRPAEYLAAAGGAGGIP